MHNKTPAERAARVPTIHIISDSIGETAQVVARAAAAQFGVTSPHLEIFSKVKSFEEVRGYLLEHARHHEEVLGDDRMLVMYTLVNADIRAFWPSIPISWPWTCSRPLSPPSPR